MAWTSESIADQRGKTFVITGANSGIGYEAAVALASKGAHVVMACRSAERAKDAVSSLKGRVPSASVEVRSLDLSSLASVRAFAEQLAKDLPKLDGLVNNAGLMALPYGKTADGFEMQLGTNHLGHFALTGLLLPTLLATPGSRIVSVASTAHRFGKIHWDDLMGERGYEAWAWYGQSKLANLLFLYELARRLEAKGHHTAALAAHPGYAATALQHKGPEMEGSRLKGAIMTVGNSLLAQGPAMGTLPTLRALCDPEAKNGEYYGPRGLFELVGYPVKVSSTKASRDRADQGRLWELSEKLTGVRYAALG
ncbi:MAG: SDR family oxidoreductase [Sandaracinaceae bacterium]|nr:SDR family oxidoreductase [Sandaracinaceae bacterium]